MGSASTALYQLLNQKVNITTPVVTVTTIKQIKENFDADLTNANDCVMILKPIRRTEKIKSEHWERTCIYP